MTFGKLESDAKGCFETTFSRRLSLSWGCIIYQYNAVTIKCTNWMLNMSIILFRYKQFASKIYYAISMYYFVCKLINDLQNSIHFITGLRLYKLKLTAARVKKGTAQWFRLANSASNFINLSSYERKSHAQKFGSVSVRFGSAKKSEVRFGLGSAKNSWFGRFLVGAPPTHFCEYWIMCIYYIYIFNKLWNIKIQ